MDTVNMICICLDPWGRWIGLPLAFAAGFLLAYRYLSAKIRFWKQRYRSTLDAVIKDQSR